MGQLGLIPIHYDQLRPADRELLDRVAAVSEDGGPAPRAAGISRSDPRLPVPAEYVELG